MITLSLGLASFWSCKLKGKLGDTLMNTITITCQKNSWRHTNIMNVADFLHTLRIQTLQPHGEQHLPMSILREMFWTILVKSPCIMWCSSKASDYSSNTARKKMATVTESGEKKPWVMHPAWGTRLSFLSETSERSRSNSQHICKKTLSTEEVNQSNLWSFGRLPFWAAWEAWDHEIHS